MKETSIKVAVVITLFIGFYTSCWFFGLPFDHPPKSLWAIPLEGAVFGVACIATFYVQVSATKSAALIAVGALANTITYFGGFIALPFGLAGYAIIAILSAIIFAFILHLFLFGEGLSKLAISVAAVIGGLVLIVPHSSFLGFLSGKLLWWLAVLGAVALSGKQHGANQQFKPISRASGTAGDLT